MAENIGFIGPGIMGRPMALNLIRAGHQVSVYARRAQAVEPLVEAGAQTCDTPQCVAENAEIIFTMVSDTADVTQVMLGEQGVIEGVKPGAVVVDMSTISPSVTRTIAAKLQEKQAHMLDAPVSGGERGAIEGTLSIMVGGDAATFERIKPLFALMGTNITHVGGNGAGQVTKACNQIVITQTLAAIGEAFILARAAGVDPAKVREALLGGFANSRILENHGKRLLERDFKPGFKAKLHHKDMRIVQEAAHELGIALPGSALVAQYLNALLGRDKGELDSIAIYQVQEALSAMV